MAINQIYIGELKREAANTRKLLELVPTAHFGWKPHEKSWTLGALATHIANLSGWAEMTVDRAELDFAKNEYKTPVINTTEELLKLHDDSVAQSIKALETVTDEQLKEIWTLRNGEQIYMQLPKVAVLRSMCFNHVYHHRGQLSVYLRLLNIPVPGMYGPSADEKAMMN